MYFWTGRQGSAYDKETQICTIGGRQGSDYHKGTQICTIGQVLDMICLVLSKSTQYSFVLLNDNGTQECTSRQDLIYYLRNPPQVWCFDQFDGLDALEVYIDPEVENISGLESKNVA